MNKANLKSYAPQARKDFIAAVTARANQLGLSNKAGSLEIAPAEKRGDVTVIAGQAWPVKIKGQRDKLIERMQKDGFDHTMEAVAYTWFNRFAALRYMEIHDYLGHGHRALSSTAGGLPDILAYATDLAGDLPGLNAAKVMELKLAGNRDGELYRMLLVAQCNALSLAMPFLFEHIDDDTELLLPDNLLRSDSVIKTLVNEIPEEDWAAVEIIGWLYQFYISEKKDQVIGKVVKSEDIPAATQLFTPNWIVQYLVQNSVGRLWLLANPQSTLAKEWPYYITPAEQTPEVQAQLDALIQTRAKEDGDTLDPESITVLDPACGSGHILVVAYDVLKAIYLERGYQPRTIPRLILEKNLFGLDIDDRAAQMASFALLMKARADDRRLFTATDDAGNLQPPKLNVLSLQESKGLSIDELANSLAPFKIDRTAVTLLVDAFEHAKTFGSLIQISQPLSQYLAFLPEALSMAKRSGDIYASAAANDLLPLVPQAQLLAMQFDAVVANPPYMGINGMNVKLKNLAQHHYPDSKSDLFAMFLERGFTFCNESGCNSMVTMQSWMFLSSYQSMREKVLSKRTIQTMAHLGARAFTEISGEVVQTTAFVLLSKSFSHFKPTFFRLIGGNEVQKKNDLVSGNFRFDSITQNEFNKIPGSPVAYWSTPQVRKCWDNKLVRDFLNIKSGLLTGNDQLFLRHWYEVSIQDIYLESSGDELKPFMKKWIPVTSGGSFKKWYGNTYQIVKARDDFIDIKSLPRNNYRLRDPSLYFKKGINWPMISSANFGAKISPSSNIMGNGVRTGFIFDHLKLSIEAMVGYLSSNIAFYFLSLINPTLNFNNENIDVVPILTDFPDDFVNRCKRAVDVSKKDWDSSEFSYGFLRNTLLNKESISALIAFKKMMTDAEKTVAELNEIEEENNRYLIRKFHLNGVINEQVSRDAITLNQNYSYRFGGTTDAPAKFRSSICEDLISYSIGCMMGRYSLDEPGLIYAYAGNIGFEPARYKTFPADADGIVPITKDLWFDDDASFRIREFLLAVWSADTLEENMEWLAESLGAKANETPDETIRHYIADKFFKDHLQTYKKRPIYWLFSSGKQGAFQALVYLHRYSEGTLSRLRAEYVVPLTSKIQNRIEMLVKDAAAASSTAARNKLNKEVEGLKKKHVELLAYDEKLRHYADMRITLDLDDGVKVNYGKFGDLLAELKAVTGGASDD